MKYKPNTITIMKHLKLTLLLTLLLSMIDLRLAAHDIEVVNSDGVTIYYNWTATENNIMALAVSCRGMHAWDYPNEYTGDLVIPASVTYDGVTYSVTSISYGAFQKCSSLTNVIIPNSVTTIGGQAFAGCSGLTHVTIPVSITSIGDYAFSDCYPIINVPVTDYSAFCSNVVVGLIASTAPSNYIRPIHLIDSEGSEIKEFIIPNDVMTIGNRAFQNCSNLTSVTIPNSVTSIGDYSFSGCNGLISIDIPNSINHIGDRTFEYCTGLLSVNIPNGVVSIGKYSFVGCTDLASVSLPNSITSLGEGVFHSCENLYSVNIPNNLTSISAELFCDCGSLSSITIPDNVTSIGYNAFAWCFSLSSIDIPANVTSIGSNAFNRCEALTSIIIPDNVTSIGSGAFSECSKLSSAIIGNGVQAIEDETFSSCGLTSFIIGDNVVSIGNRAFGGCSKLRTLSVGNNISSIGNLAFAGCSNLSSLSIPNSVTSIGEAAFRGCSGLTSINIPDNLSVIKKETFSGCSRLESITIPAKIEYIYQEAFANCNSLKLVHALSTTPPFLYDNSFSSDTKNNALLLVPKECCESYKDALGWKSFANISGDSFVLTYQIGSDIYKTIETSYGTKITPEPYPTKDGFSFSGWMGLPETMPAKDLIVTGFYTDYGQLYGHEYADLGLPSGNAWATVNYGSSSLGAPGSYRSWQSKVWSEQWIIPSRADFQELLDYCTWAWINGEISGYLVTGRNGNSVFLPASGCLYSYAGYEPIGYNQELYYWSSDNIDEYSAYALIGTSTSINIDTPLSAWQCACSIRPIVKNAIERPSYNLIYIVDNEEYKRFQLKEGDAISPEPAPIKEGYTFSGWSEIPSTMPAHDVTVTGTFTVNKYQLTYIVDGEEYKTYEVEYGATITPEPEPTKEGFVFSGWNGLPETMPAHVVIVTGTFSKAKYMLTYMVDGEVYKSQEMDYGAAITPEPAPTKEGHTFSGWSEIPATMPAHDVMVTGSFSVNKYILTYILDGKEYKTMEVEYGTAITPEPNPEKEGYTFSGWSEIPETMPAHIVIITGSFSINSYTLTYMIDEVVYKQVVYEYGAAITPEPQPEGDYVSFEWVGLPETMPAHDVTVTAVYETGIAEIMMMAQQGQLRIYSPNGKLLSKLQKGLNIVVMQDGTTKKVVVK